MKYLIALLLLFSIVYGQGTVKTVKSFKDGGFIYGTATDYEVLGKYGDADTSDAFSLKGWDGATVLWMIADTSDADSAVVVTNTSDSCLAIRLQLYDADIGWGGLYSETTNNYTTLDTVSRVKLNVAGTVVNYLPLAEETAWAVADSARFIFFIGVGDTLPFKARIKGQ